MCEGKVHSCVKVLDASEIQGFVLGPWHGPGRCPVARERSAVQVWQADTIAVVLVIGAGIVHIGAQAPILLGQALRCAQVTLGAAVAILLIVAPMMRWMAMSHRARWSHSTAGAQLEYTRLATGTTHHPPPLMLMVHLELPLALGLKYRPKGEPSRAAGDSSPLSWGSRCNGQGALGYPGSRVIGPAAAVRDGRNRHAVPSKQVCRVIAGTASGCGAAGRAPPAGPLLAPGSWPPGSDCCCCQPIINTEEGV